MRKHKGELLYSPSDLITFMDSPFDSWAERYSKEYPSEFEADPADEGLDILQKLGIKHETDFLNRLIETGKDVANIQQKGEAGELDTIVAMRAGREIIYQGVLSQENFAGQSDFLFKVPGKSELGSYHYEAWDTKLSREVKPYFITQLCCYSEMLERIQGRLPDRCVVVLGNCEEESFLVRDFVYQYHQLKKAFLRFQSEFSKNVPPEECISGKYSRWNKLSEKMLEERDDLYRVANIRRTQITRLKAAGITTMTELAESSMFEADKISLQAFETLQRQARLQIKTNSEKKTSYELLTPLTGKGLALLPPASKLDAYFDMEGFPLIEDGLEYLFGVVHCENGIPKFSDWWAHDREQEKRAFEDFIDWVYARWLEDPGMHIYHYASYELTAMRKLAGRHSTRVDEVDNLLRNEVFVDLYQVVRQGLIIGEPSYSIKCVEHLFRGKRGGEVSTAGDSVIFYDRWREAPDGADWTSSQILKLIRDYNEVDCASTLDLAVWLRDKQSKAAIKYTGKPVGTPPKVPDLSPQANLAQRMLLQAKSMPDDDARRLHELLAHLLEFHKREDKPMWWRMFDRQKASTAELVEDLDCLAGLRRTLKKGEPIRHSTCYEYSFDPDQDTKCEEGGDCLFVHDLNHVVLESIDRKKGIACLAVGPGKPEPPSDVSIMRSESVSNKILAQSIFQQVARYESTGFLSPAIKNLLMKNEPQLSGRKSGELVAKSSALAEVIDAIVRMQNTTLCLQGPPGTGKTYSGSRAIVELLRQGKRVGVTSNSHKAIENLLQDICEVAVKAKVALRGMKIAGEEFEPKHKSVCVNFQQVKDSGTFYKSCDASDFNLLAGTAWFFSNEKSANLVTHLFVDEAGQVSLANCLAMAPCTNNIILLGDQMQLEQPVQGTHPAESGMSCLEYLLQGCATIPPNMGVFLDTSYRMHPALCKLISESVYDSRLRAGADCVNQVLLSEPKSADGKNAGVIFLPVSHSGNSQCSEEEVDVIAELVRQLVGIDYHDEQKKKLQLRLEDILIVTPYNMQVRLIANRLPGARVASVDKFQGQEAPVVILSMCCSDGVSSPRGLDFLFSKNRLNVALSRARTMAFVVGNPNLVATQCNSVKQMKLLNFYCQIYEYATLSQVNVAPQVIVDSI
jgi:predicted RecB family nuclease